MKFAVILAVLPAMTLSMPVSVDSFTSLFTRQTAALNSATDRLLFSTSIGGFITARNAKNPAGLDWSSDGCSSSPDNPFGFNFINSCYRHDFGYRNYKKQNRFTDANKLRIDNNFKTDMYNQCATEQHQDSCRTTANVYYEAVRAFGKRRAEAEVEAALEVEME